MAQQVDIVGLLTQQGKDYKCPECQGRLFDQKHIAREVSAFQSPNGQKIRGYLPVYICSDCGTMIKESWMKDTEADKEKSE